MERKAFSFLSGIAWLKERKSPSRLETIESNILNLVSKIETCFSFAIGSVSYRSLTKRLRRLTRMVEYTHEHFYLHFKLFNAWLDHYQSKLFSLYLLWSLNLHEEKNRSLGVCSTKKTRFLEKNGCKIFVFFYKRLRLFENHNLESGWVRLPQKLLRWWCIPIRCISIVLVMYSNLMYCFVSAIVLCVYAL